MEPGRETVLDYDFPRFGTVGGVLRGPDGRPLRGEVRLLREIGPDAHAHADEKGRFRLPEPLPAGRHRLRAWAPDREPTVVEIEVRRGEETLLSIALRRR